MRLSFLSVLTCLTGMFGANTALAQNNITADVPVDTADVGAVPVLTLEKCVEIALSTNPTIKVADLEIERVDYSRKDAIAQLLPAISFGANYNRMIAKQVAYMDFDMSSLGGGTTGEDTGESQTTKANSKKGGSDGIKMGRDNSYQLGFSASMPLIAPQMWAQIKLTDSQIAQNVEQARASRLDMINQVNSAYYKLLLAHDSKKVIQQSYEMAALTHDIYQKQFSAGAASEYDVLRTSVAMKNIEPELLQADISIRQAALQLCILMGMPGDFNFTVAGKLSDYEATMYSDALGIDRDYSANSSLRMNELQNNTLRQSLRVAKMAWYPTLSLTANYNWNSSSNGSPFKNFRWDPYSVVGITLNVPLFQGGSRVNKIRQAEIEIEQNRLTRQDLERTISMQVDLAIDNIRLNVEQIASNSESVAEAERAHSIMEQSFEIGAASYLDLRDSELTLTRSRLTYYQSIYNYLIARSELQLLLGHEK